MVFLVGIGLSWILLVLSENIRRFGGLLLAEFQTQCAVFFIKELLITFVHHFKMYINSIMFGVKLRFYNNMNQNRAKITVLASSFELNLMFLWDQSQDIRA